MLVASDDPGSGFPSYGALAIGLVAVPVLGVSPGGGGGIHAVGRRMHWPHSTLLLPRSFALFSRGFLGGSVCAGVLLPASS